jgi:hypothetical protein
MAVVDEVQRSDTVDVDRRHRLTPPARRRDPLPAALLPTGAGAKVPVEVAATVDGADDRLEGDYPRAEVPFGDPPQGRHHVVEGQYRQLVPASHPQARSEPRE